MARLVVMGKEDDDKGKSLAERKIDAILITDKWQSLNPCFVIDACHWIPVRAPRIPRECVWGTTSFVA